MQQYSRFNQELLRLAARFGYELKATRYDVEKCEFQYLVKMHKVSQKYAILL